MEFIIYTQKGSAKLVAGNSIACHSMAVAGMCSGANKYEPSVEWLAVSCHRRF
jgi:hypothetical protein